MPFLTLFFSGLLGGMQDYNYLYGNCLEITMELSCCKYPAAAELHKEWDLNRESLLSYIEKVKLIFLKSSDDTTAFISSFMMLKFSEMSLVFYDIVIFQIHIGVRGYVKDAVSDAALTDASILVSGIRHNLTTGQYGDYYRLLIPGTYNITAVARG